MYETLSFSPRTEERRARNTESSVCWGRTRGEGVGFEGIGSNSMACFGSEPGPECSEQDGQSREGM